jgi:hypothetical protein
VRHNLLILLIKNEIELYNIYNNKINNDIIFKFKLIIKKFKQRRMIRKHYYLFKKTKYLIECFYSGYIYGYDINSPINLITKENCIIYLCEKKIVIYDKDCIEVNRRLEKILKNYEMINKLLEEQYNKKWKI